MNPLLIRRRGMMVAQGGGLPYDAKIEYLQGDGNQYINTDIVPTNTTGMAIDMLSLVTSDAYACGIRDTTGNTRFCIGQHDYVYFGWGVYSAQTQGTIQLQGYKVHAELNMYNSRQFYYSGNNQSETLSSVPSSLGFTPTNKIRVFGSSGVVGTYTKFVGRIYAFSVTKDSALVFDAIPVRVGTVGYMYDRVSGQLFGNLGTGDFILGPDIQ